MDVVFDIAEEISVLHFGAVLGDGGHAEAVSTAANACRKSTWGPSDHGDRRSPGHPHLLRRRLRAARAVAGSSNRARFWGLLGRNGVGKTTLVNSIVGFNPPRRGKGDLQGRGHHQRVVVRDRAQRHGPGAAGPPRVPDAERRGEPGWWGGTQCRPSRLERRGRVYALFPRLQERRIQRAKTLSGGEQQMLAIGRALMTNPDCLIMDEPSEGLAPRSSSEGPAGGGDSSSPKASPSCWWSRTPTSRSNWSTTST